MPPPPPVAEVVVQQAGDAGLDSGVPLPRTLQPGVRRTMPRAASTTASGVAAASRAVATHGLGGGADPARVRSNRQLQDARKRAKQQEAASRAPAAAQAAVWLAGGHYVFKCHYLSKRARKLIHRLGAAPPLGTRRPGHRGLLGRGGAVRGHGQQRRRERRGVRRLRRRQLGNPKNARGARADGVAAGRQLLKRRKGAKQLERSP